MTELEIPIKVEEVTEPQIFNPPKRMIVWSKCEGKPCNVCEREVVAILPPLPYHANVICLNGASLWWATHCGILKEKEYK